MYKVVVLQPGYSIVEEDGSMRANGTSTLVIGEGLVVLVDTLSPWDKELLLAALAREGFAPGDVTHLVCTHGHPDHVGNNNLFTSAKMHIMGHAIHHKDVYRELEPEGLHLDADGYVRVIATPGHTLDSVSVVVVTGTKEQGTVVIAGDNFEKEEDLQDPDLWKSAGSEDEEKQVESRRSVLDLADWVVPGHGKMFPAPKITQK